jgi:phosphate-selective porin
MRKLVYSAVALTLVSVPGFANENEWSSLDQEINNLSTSLSAQNAAGPKLGGFIKTSFRYSDDTDALFGPGNTEDEVGFKIDKVRIEITGDLGQDYSYRISFDLSSGVAETKDAYVSWKMAESVKGTMGRFKKPFLRSSQGSDKNTLLYERTALGNFFDARQEGLMFSGNFDTIEWWIAGQNDSSKENDFNYTARLAANLMGSGAGKVEGAYGAGEETNLTVGIAYAEEQELDDGTTIGVDAALTSGPFSLSGELVDFDNGTSDSFPSKGGDGLHYGSGNTLVTTDPSDSTPWDITGSYMFTDVYEAALRYEDADDDDSTNAWTIGVNRYIQGHDIKWTVQVLNSTSDVDSNEVTEWTLGLTVGI